MCDLISGLPSIHPRQSHRSQHRTSQSKATRSAFHTLTELVRKPGASLSGFFNTATAVSALADEAHNELETSKSILRLKLQYVCLVRPQSVPILLTRHTRRPRLKTGKQLPLNSMSSKATTSGGLKISQVSIITPWCKPDWINSKMRVGAATAHLCYSSFELL